MSLSTSCSRSPRLSLGINFTKDSEMYLGDIPCELANELIVLDYDDGWEKLGSVVGLTVADRQRLVYLRQQGKSPTMEIISKWHYKNATIYDLYYALKKINRLREVSIIENFLKSRNISLKEVPVNSVPIQNNSRVSVKDDSVATCESLKHLNPDCLPRPSERNVLQQKQTSHLPVPSRPSVPFFHKPLNTDEPHSNDSVNVNKEMNHKDIDRVPKVDWEESSPATKSLPTSKNVSSLIPYLELGCLFTYDEIMIATDGFRESNILGSGAFGTVYYGKLKETDCAIKKLTKDYSEVNAAMCNLKKNALDELLIQIKFRHPNVVNLYGYSLDNDETCFIYEFMENGSLEDCLACKHNPPLTWSERLKIAQDSACGLQYLHTQKVPVIHGDVKSSNILIDKHKEAKIGDFGLAMFATNGTDTGILTHVSNSMTGSLFGTVAYMPPEFPRSSGKQYLESDVYSFGVVLYEILTGQKAYDENRTSKRFLMEYIDLMLEIEEENLNNCEDISTDLFIRLKEILDPQAGPCFQNTIQELYLLTTKCTRSKRKRRPSMLSVFEKLQKINIILHEMMEETAPKTNSLPYQLQQLYDARNQSSSGVPLEDKGTYLVPTVVNPDQHYVPPTSTTMEEQEQTKSSESLPVSSAESLKMAYQEKPLTPSMNSFFENYQKLVAHPASSEEHKE